MRHGSLQVFRIDDISLNTSQVRLREMIDIIKAANYDARVILAISPVVFDMSEAEGLQKERAFPKILNVESDHRLFFEGNIVGVPPWVRVILAEYDNVYTAGHGMCHVDHRLMDFQAQELSIIQSCAIARSHTFVPPFHKWNEDTDAICKKHGLTLVKMDVKKMRHVLYHDYDPSWDGDYYFHTHDFDVDDFRERMGVVLPG